MNNDFRTIYLGNWNLNGCMVRDPEGNKCNGNSDHIIDFKGNIGYFYIGKNKIT